MYLKLLKQFSCLTIFCIGIFSFSLTVYAQQLNSEQIKSVYLVNFLKHVHWPDEQQKSSYIIAVYQNDTLYQTFSNALNNRLVKGIPISVISANNIKTARQADLVFSSLTQKVDVTPLAAGLRRSNTLLVTDNSVDKRNFMINLLFDAESSAITFEVNKSNIVYEHLTMSKELLILGGTEIDVATLYRETEIAMQGMRERELKLNQELAVQQQQYIASSQKLQQLNADLMKRTQVADKRQRQLTALKKDIELQQLSIITQENQLVELLKQLSTAQYDFDKQQLSVEKKEQENSLMAEKISANKKILGQQQHEIGLQTEQLVVKNEELAEGKALIDQQQFYLFLMTILVFFALLFLSLVIWLFSKNKKTTLQLSQSLKNLKEMQDQLVQSEKLASLGKLTAGVAHEINTPLGIAVTSTSSAMESTKVIKENFEQNNLTRSAMIKYFQAMTDSAELNTSSLGRVIELLNNFKQVAADQVVGEVREISLVNYINEILLTLSAEMKKHRVDYQCSGDAEITIETIPGALAQIITNLVTNSLIHGFENKNSGNITIDVQAKTNEICLVYRDDGIGMTEEVLQNIFEPFFTTKRSSGGTGLGMNIVYNIICHKLKGNIVIESKPNEGSCFHITLPFTLEE
jgi:signal transduction histidine kinase